MEQEINGKVQKIKVVQMPLNGIKKITIAM